MEAEATKNIPTEPSDAIPRERGGSSVRIPQARRAQHPDRMFLLLGISLIGTNLILGWQSALGFLSSQGNWLENQAKLTQR